MIAKILILPHIQYSVFWTYTKKEIAENKPKQSKEQKSKKMIAYVRKLGSSLFLKF